MAKAELEVISRETIRPSSPTPLHLRHYQLSSLDKTAPPIYVSRVLFFTAKNNGKAKPDIADILIRLKTSLADTLTRYYPLAGRLKDNHVECNDEGVPFLEARVRCHLSDVLQKPEPMDLRRFVPFVLNAHDDVLLGVQLNVFKCGGVALGVCLSHKVVDGSSFIMFKKIWAAICRGEKNLDGPEFASAKLFPPETTILELYDPRTEIITTEDFIMKRFVFGPHAVEALRTKYAAGMDLNNNRRPTRVETLSVFIWSRFMASTQAYAQPGGPHYFMVHPVNLRTRFEPPLPEHSFGNINWMAVTFPYPSTGDMSQGLMSKVREAIRGMDRDYVQRLRAGDGLPSFLRPALGMYIKGDMISLKFSSVCKFPVYEADFGWGEPAWAGMPAMPLKNMVVFMDTKSQDGGVEAYVSLKKEDMARFEHDEELHSFVSPPSIA